MATGANWFRPRRYGYGASPATWQGWAMIVALPIGLALLTVVLFAWVRPMALAFALFALMVPAVVCAFIAVARYKTGGEWRWRWPRRDRDKDGE